MSGDLVERLRRKGGVSRSLAIRNAKIEQAESAWQCHSCSAPSEEDSRYCRHCRMYWEDVDNGLFADDDDWQTEGASGRAGE